MIRTNKKRQYNPSNCSDVSAIPSTQTLYRYLMNCQPNILTGCSEQFKSNNQKYDITGEIYKITSEYPAFLTWEIYTAQTALSNKNTMLQDCNTHLSNGGIVGLHDHPGNPVTSTLFDTGYTGTGTGYADRSGTPLAQIKSGGGLNSTYLSYLDEIADIISHINGPVIYRPFHEINGTWFWWNGSDRRADMVLVWQQTVDYLRNTKGLHNILFVLNYDANGELGDVLYGSQALSTWWPGASYVDIISIDYYPSTTPYSIDTARFNSAYSEVVALAAQYNKPVGISEYGAQSSIAQTQQSFWYDNFFIPLKTKFKEVTFFCTWNGDYAPVQNGASSDGFRQIFNNQGTITLNNIDLEKP